MLRAMLNLKVVDIFFYHSNKQKTYIFFTSVPPEGEKKILYHLQLTLLRN